MIYLTINFEDKSQSFYSSDSIEDIRDNIFDELSSQDDVRITSITIEYDE